MSSDFRPGDLITLKKENFDPVDRPYLFTTRNNVRRVEPGEVFLVLAVQIDTPFVLAQNVVTWLLPEYFERLGRCE